MEKIDTIPQMISTKDLAYLSDMFHWNYNAYKEIDHFITEVKNEEIKEMLERVRNMHEDHLHFIISILKKEEYDECDCSECECEECGCDDEDELEEELEDEEDLDDEE